MIKNLVISGGGLSGIGMLGIIFYLEQKKLLLNVKNYLGTSVGSIISLLLIIGYNSKELMDFIEVFNFKKITSKLSLSVLLKKYGFSSNEKIIYVLKNFIINKKFNPNITFKQLYNKTNKNLIITGTCINENKLYYFNKDKTPNMHVITAISISICIPFVFKPINFNNKLWIDGGILNNYPINYFDKHLKNTLGITIAEECYENCSINQINNLKEYIINVGKCLIYGQNYINILKYENNSIKFIHCYDNIVSFEIDKKTKQKYFKLGFESAKKQKKKLYKFYNNNKNNKKNI